MEKYKLFYYPRNASWAPHMLLEEINVDFELVLVDRKSEAQKTSDYLQLNPTGRIPTFIDDNLVIFESAAICLHLCEKHPESNMMPPIGSPYRHTFFQWLFYLTTTIQPELMLYFYPHKHTSQTETAKAITEMQEKRITEMFKLLDEELTNKKFLVGNQISICDLFLFMLAHWASDFKTPPLSLKNLGNFLKNMAQRPAIQRACEKERTNLEKYL